MEFSVIKKYIGDNQIQKIYIGDEKISDIKIIEKNEPSDKTTLRFSSYNIGHFALGRGGMGGTKITVNEKEIKRKKYIEHIKKANNGSMPDIIGFCEYDDKFSIDGEKTDEYLFPNYKQKHKAKFNGYNANCLFSNNINIVDKGIIKADVPNGSAYRDLCWMKIMIDGKEVLVIQTHITTMAPSPGIAKNKYEQWEKVRIPEMNQLAEIFKNNERVVMMADWNMVQNQMWCIPFQYDNSNKERVYYFGHGWGSESVKQTYLQDGSPKYIKELNGLSLPLKYAVGKLNHDAIFERDNDYDYGGSCVDNIICKGIEISDVKVIYDDTLSDHPIVGATLTF